MCRAAVADGDFFACVADGFPEDCNGAGRQQEAVMSWVGSGSGGYIKETTYRYVGAGSGEFHVVQVGGRPWVPLVGGVVLIVVAVFVLLFCTTPSDSTTNVKSVHFEPVAPTSALFDCSAGVSNWEAGWSNVKKSWCCADAGVGCAPKCMTGSCDATCYHDVDNKGHADVTCRERISWAKEHSEILQAKTLQGAIVLVNKECECQCSCAEADFAEPPPNVGTCSIVGDHFQTFDGSRTNVYGEGQVWLVKSGKIWVQLRYLATPATNGLAAAHDIAVGGPFMNQHILRVGPLRGGKIIWDFQAKWLESGVASAAVASWRKEILMAFGEFDPAGLGKISYDNKGQLLDSAQEGLPRHIVHVLLPGNLFMQIYRWENHLNVRIRMPPTPNQDGHCGNFNGDKDDDARDMIVGRIGDFVAKADLMFDTDTPRTHGKAVSLDDCPEDKRQQAEQNCRAALDAGDGSDDERFRGCVFDVCFVGERYAAQEEVEGW